MKTSSELLLKNRLLLPLNSGFENHIEALFKVMLKRFKDLPEQYHPELVLCQSANKHTSMSQVRGDDSYYLVFDTHLIEVIYQLALLNNSVRTENDLYSFVYHTIAEEYLSKGKLSHAKVYTDAYIHTPQSRYYHETSNEAITKAMIFYEAFIIFHELSHWFSFRINSDAKWKLERHRNVCLDIFTRHLESVKESYDDDLIMVLKKQINHIQQNDKFVEESYCDMFASYLIMETWGDKRPLDSAIHAQLALRYIQFIQILQYFTSVNDFDEEADIGFFEMNIRCIVQNAYVNGEVRKRCPSNMDKYHKKNITAMEEYEMFLETPLYYMMEKLQKLSDKINKGKTIEFYEDGYDDLFELVRSIICD